MEKKLAYELAESNAIVKCINIIGFIVIAVGIILGVANAFQDWGAFLSGLSLSTLGLGLVGLSYIVKAAIMYININEE